MWASVRRYEGNPDLAERLAERADEIRALIGDVPGLVAYYLIHDGSDTVSVTVAEDQTGVDASNVVAATWLRENMPDLAPAPPTITEGEVLVTTSH